MSFTSTIMGFFGSEDKKPAQIASMEDEKPAQIASVEDEKPVQIASVEDEKPAQIASVEDEKPVQIASVEDEKPAQSALLKNLQLTEAVLNSPRFVEAVRTVALDVVQSTNAANEKKKKRKTEKFLGWSISFSGGSYRLQKTINKKPITLYVGRSWDQERAIAVLRKKGFIDVETNQASTDESTKPEEGALVTA